jgi:hypothetical protein
MNTDPSRPGETPADQPSIDGGGLRLVEDRLRRSLEAEANAITPTDRLGAILDEGHAGTGFAGTSRASRSSGPGSRHHRWILPAAAAATAVLVTGTVWAVSRPPAQTPPVAATPTAVATPTPGASSATPSSGRSSVPTQTAAQPSTPAPSATTGAQPPATTTVSVPVYYLGPVAAGSGQMRLFREFVSSDLPSPSVPSGNAVTALRLAMGPAPAGSPYHSAWTGVTAESVTAGGSSITVRLSSGTRDATPLAAEQLVWTVQAALGSSLPVHFELADGSTDVAPGHAASTSYTRPSDQMAVLGQVAPIWVDEPARGSVVKAGAPLTVSGVASTFEANVQWQLLREGKVVDSGFTTASRGAPARGSYTFPTKQSLTAGAYVLRVFATSANDGSTVAEQVVPFTAR